MEKQPQSTITVYGTNWCGDCKRTRRFLDERGVAYIWIDIDVDPNARKFVEETNHGFRSVPTIIFPDGSFLVEPSNSQVAKKLVGWF